MNRYCMKYINSPPCRYKDKYLTDSQCLTFYIIPGGEGANDSDDVPSTDKECLERFNKEDWAFFCKREPQLVVKVRYDLLKGRRKQDGELCVILHLFTRVFLFIPNVLAWNLCFNASHLATLAHVSL